MKAKTYIYVFHCHFGRQTFHFSKKTLSARIVCLWLSENSTHLKGRHFSSSIPSILDRVQTFNKSSFVHRWEIELKNVWITFKFNETHATSNGVRSYFRVFYNSYIYDSDGRNQQPYLQENREEWQNYCTWRINSFSTDIII